MIGNRQKSAVSSQQSGIISDLRQRIFENLKITKQRTADGGRRTKSAGFTLLELMIVLFIIVILATVILPQYQRSVLKARETVLKDNLHTMRRMIDQYAADKGKLPKTLDDLVSAGYLREVPIDPMTENNEWEPKFDTDVNSLDDEQGIVDVFSKSTDTGSDGRAYNEW